MSKVKIWPEAGKTCVPLALGMSYKT